FTPFSPIPDEIRLVQNFLRTEISPGFELVDMLSRGVGVHHAGLSDEIRALIEWLAEEDKLRVLCATTTIAQGINFPVSSVFLASRFVPQGNLSRSLREISGIWLVVLVECITTALALLVSLLATALRQSLRMSGELRESLF